MLPLRTWMIGRVNAPELSLAADWIRATTHSVEFEDLSPAVAAAAQHRLPPAAGSAEPDLVVLFVSRPGEMRRWEVDSLQAAFPLARLLAVLGPWCEGEVRSGRPWPGTTRIYWHQWQPRLIEIVNDAARADVRPLPRTANAVDAELHRADLVKRAVRGALVGVVSSRRADFAALGEALAADGHRAVWLFPHEPVPILHADSLIIDSSTDLAEAAEMLEAMRSKLGPVPAALLCNFVRPDEIRSFAQLGAAVVISKPYLVADLLMQLDDLMYGPPGQTARSTTAAA